MDIAETTEPVAQTGTHLSRTIGDVDVSLDAFGDDGRSSSLSEIDDVSENELSDDELPQPQRTVPEEVDSEAETERLEDSPNRLVPPRNIKLREGQFESSPSKLAQSTTYDEIDEDDDNELTDTPSKNGPSSKPNGNGISANSDVGAREKAERRHSPPAITGQKRKHISADEDADAEPGDENEPARKRRGSFADAEMPDATGAESLATREETEEAGVNEAQETANDENRDSLVTGIATRGRRGVRRGKRKGRKARDVEDDLDNGDAATENTEDQLPEDEETGDLADDANDADVAAKSEEELARKVAAIDSLAILEKEFATLREKIYDEKIAKFDRELEQLTSPQPSHPELMRQIESLRRYRDKKLDYEHTLYQYRMQSLVTRSLADRAAIHSSYFQRVRDTREKHSTAVSKQFYAIQHDRFKTEEIGANHYIPFPTRRSQQISQQAAYNQEVSVMAGVAKYVGFPAAPNLSAARALEADEDFEKMGISVEHRPIVAPQGGIRGATSSDPPRHAVAEEHSNNAHEQHFAWANPYPSHAGFMASLTTPAAQKRVIDINAPNGSASTIADNASAANSSTANTPYRADQEQHHNNSGHGPSHQAGSVDFDALDRKSGFRSQTSSPLDVRKGPANHPNHPNHPNNSFFEARHEPTRNPGYSPPPRFGLFTPSKAESSPPLASSNKSLGGIHSSGLMTGSGPSRMIAR